MAPTARKTGQRLRAGIQVVTDITSTYAIENYTNQSDQLQDNQVAVPWCGPVQMIPPERALIAVNGDESASAHGFITGVLGPFTFWTFGQISYILTTFFAAGVYSASVSMMLYDTTDTAFFLTATAYRPVRNEQFQDYEPAVAGWANVGIRFAEGVIIT